MGMNTVSVVGPRSQAQPREKESESDLDKLMKGIQLASGILGIGVNVQQIRAHQGTIEGNEMKNATLADERSGVLSATQKAEISKSMEPVAIGTPGSTTHRFRGKDGQVEELALSIPKKAAPAPQVDALGQERLKLEREKFDYQQKKDARDLAIGTPKPKGKTDEGGPNPQASFDQRLSGLNAEERKRLDSASMGLQAIGDMSVALESGSNTFSVVGDNEFTMARRNFEEALGRMQSGGAINSEEAARFAKMAPTWQDSAEIQTKKLQNLQAEMSLRVKNLGFDPNEIMDARANAAGPQRGASGKWGEATAAPKAEPTAEEKAALNWLRANPKHPDAQGVMQTLKAKGLL
jgi:hypothetical protein